MDNNQHDNTGNPKKSPLRKKVVDLKAVAALLEDSDGAKSTDSAAKARVEPPGKVGPPGRGGHSNPDKAVFQPNEELIQATARIKSQRDLIKKRCQKMEQSREKVSKNVFYKV